MMKWKGKRNPNGIITFKLLYETSDLTYQIDADNATAEITVTDNDGGQTLPQINISAEDSIVEGEEIIFRLTATPIDGMPLTTDLSVVINISQTGNFLANEAGDRPSITIRPRETKIHSEPTIWVENRASSGKITAEIQADSASTPTYSRGSEFRKVVNVELYSGPIVTVNAPTSSIVAGTPAIFDISVSSPPDTSAFNVLVNISPTHDVIQWRIPSGVIIPAGDSSRRLQIPTRKNMKLPEDMEVSITIIFRESSDYRFREGTEAIVIVWS